jgi:hypothetical protein
MSSSVTVPNDFVGLHYWGWPQLAVPSQGWTNIPAPTAMNHAVSWPFDWHSTAPGKISWALMEPTQGNYVWADFDAYVAGQASLGKIITYYMHHMPSWASANPTYTYTSATGGDGFGGPLNATGRTALTNFITAMVARYKAKGTPIKYFSIWEEPNQFLGPYNGTTVLNGGTWWGSKGDLVDLSWITYTACKAADPTIVVYSPSTADNNAGPDVWIGSLGTVNTTKHGYDSYDVYTVDPFGYAPTQFNWGTDVTQSTYATNQLNFINGSQSFATLIASIKAKMIVGGKTTPIAFVSCGYTGAYSSPAIVTLFRSKTALFRKQYIARSMLEAAALGVTQMTWYGADTNNTLGVAINQPIGTAASNASEFSGNFLTDTDGVIAGLNEFAANVPGKTIISCGYMVDGSMRATFSDGSTYTI